METHGLVAVEWSQGIEDAWSDVARFLPKLVAFLAVLLVGYIVARIIARIVDRVLKRLGADRAAERSGISAVTRSGHEASAILSKALFYVVMLVVLQMAFGVFGANAVSDMIDGVIAYVPNVVAALVIVWVAAVIAAAVRDIVTSSVGGLSYGPSLGLTAYIAILVVGGFAALNQLDIATDIVNAVFYATLAVVAGSAIVAIGGGGVQPMRHRWERTLARYDEEKPRVRQQVQESRRDEGTGDAEDEGTGGRSGGQDTGSVSGRGDVDVSRSEERIPDYGNR